jgi:hypothetical protein
VVALARRFQGVGALFHQPFEATIQVSPVSVIIVAKEAFVLVPILTPCRKQCSERASGRCRILKLHP